MINTSEYTSPAPPNFSTQDALKQVNNPAISLVGVSKIYKPGKQPVKALLDITLDINRGEFIALTGPSGSGKSTLLHLIGCLDKPTTGSIQITGHGVAKLSDNALSELRKETFGFVFQSFYLQPFLNVADNIAVPAMFTKTSKKEITGKVAQLLQKIGLSERSKHLPKELSGGQIQRAAIARALVNSPSIILADEPTGNLDSTNSQAIIDLFKAIRDQLGATIVIVTHDESIARQADRVVELRDGAIV